MHTTHALELVKMGRNFFYIEIARVESQLRGNLDTRRKKSELETHHHVARSGKKCKFFVVVFASANSKPVIFYYYLQLSIPVLLLSLTGWLIYGVGFGLRNSKC